jgi:hypothetical protein
MYLSSYALLNELEYRVHFGAEVAQKLSLYLITYRWQYSL